MTRRVPPARRLLLCLVLLGLAAAGRAPAAAGEAAENLLVHADFDAWVEGAPVGWTLSEGARQGEGPSSVVAPLDGGGLRLSGDATTRVWRSVSQRLPTREGVTYRMAFEVRVADLRREAGQFDNAFVGVAQAQGTGRPVHRIESPSRAAWTPAEVVFRGTGRGDEAVVFLSKSGTLEVRALSLVALEAKDAFDVLVRNMGRYYAQFAARPELDWPALVAAHRPKFPSDGDPARFVAAAKDFLAGVKDPHVWIRPATGETIVPWSPPVAVNADFRAVAKALRGAVQIGRVGLAGDVGEDVGYLAVGSLALDDADATRLAGALEERLRRKGLLLDLRANGGGAEARAYPLVAPLVDEPRVYARRRVRTGPAPTDLSDAFDARLPAGRGVPYAGPVVVLVGPGCVSSGEGMAQMLRALPRATFVGAPTRGASGNPAPVDLPNGVSVWFSRWIDELPDGTVLENRGVVPDVEVAFTKDSPSGDSVFDAGVKVLRERLAAGSGGGASR